MSLEKSSQSWKVTTFCATLCVIYHKCLSEKYSQVRGTQEERGGAGHVVVFGPLLKV